MNTQFSEKPAPRFWFLASCGSLLGAGLLVDQNIIAAPSVIASQAPAKAFASDWEQSQVDEIDVFTQPTAGVDNSVPSIFRYGPLLLRPHAGYRFLYGNGIMASAGNQEASAIQELSPGLLLDLGTHWAFDYTPTIRFYSNSKFRDNVDHAFQLSGGGLYGDWRLGLTHGSAFTTAPLAETGGQTEQWSHNTGITASRAFNPEISADFAINQQIGLVADFQDTYTWSTLDWLNYRFWPRLNVGLGAGGGYVKINDTSKARTTEDLDQTFEQVQARVNWRVLEKVSLQVSGGFEDRQFNSAGSGDSLNPIFGASLQYQPFKNTQISVSANRTISSSQYYVAAQQAESTSVGLNLDQRFLKKFLLGLGVAYGTTEYSTAVTTFGGSRSDDNVSFNARLSHPIFKRGTASVFYQYSDNQSSDHGLSFQSNQAGFEVSYRF